MSALFGLDLFLVALSLLGGVFVGVAAYQNESAAVPDGASANALWLNGFFLIFFLGLVPGVWALVSRNRPIRGGLRYLGFTSRWRHATFVGVGLAGVTLLAAILFLLVVAPFLPTQGEDGVLAALYSQITWVHVVFLSIAAGVSEEIFFRGVLYRWLGWWGQAPFFALAHFASGEPIQLLFTLGLGLAFGWLRRIGWSLWTLIIAHTVYDAFLLGVSVYLS